MIMIMALIMGVSWVAPFLIPGLITFLAYRQHGSLYRRGWDVLITGWLTNTFILLLLTYVVFNEVWVLVFINVVIGTTIASLLVAGVAKMMGVYKPPS